MGGFLFKEMLGKGMGFFRCVYLRSIMRRLKITWTTEKSF